MKCHVCNGARIQYVPPTYSICPHCKGTGEAPFDAQTELAELRRKVAALEQTADAKAAPPVNHAERKMRDLIGFLDRIITRHERKLSALEERESPPKPTLPERPFIVNWLVCKAGEWTNLCPTDCKQITDYILALEKGCGR